MPASLRSDIIHIASENSRFGHRYSTLKLVVVVKLPFIVVTVIGPVAAPAGTTASA
jgi:hypothetical protein